MVWDIRESHEGKRGCGYRKPGCLYLVGPVDARRCGKLPLPLSACPVCGVGFKPARGWTWVKGDELLRAATQKCDCCFDGCPLSDARSPWVPMQRVGLLWIGKSFYPTVEHFEGEAAKMGICRRIAVMPRGFEVGQTFVWLAHRQATAVPTFWSDGSGVEHKPGVGAGVFRVFRPTAVEYVVKGTESDGKLRGLEARGVSLVRVVPEVCEVC